MKTYSHPQNIKEDIKDYINDGLDTGIFGLLIQRCRMVRLIDQVLPGGLLLH